MRCGPDQLREVACTENKSAAACPSTHGSRADHYISRIEDPNVYDALFFDTVATRLAADLAEPLTQSTTKKKALMEEYDAFIDDAKRADAQENPPAEYEEDDWISVRY